ncbi:MAG: PorT family protein [Chitinophagia bacterium]|nr:PorT family protein [Chitinophagia bacterium]
MRAFPRNRLILHPNPTHMKRIAILSAALLLGLSAAQAQGVKLGVRFGSTLYKIDGQQFKDGFNFGYHLGGALEVMFSKKFGIQPEVLFNKSKTETASNLGSIAQGIRPSVVADLNYLSIPVLLNIRPSGGPLVIQAGPQFGIMMSNGSTLVQNGQAAFKSGDLSLLGGLQLNLAMFRIYGRYGIGLSNINDVSDQTKWKSQMAQLGVGINF